MIETVRKMQLKDKNIVIDMMRRFYNSPALITNGSEDIYNNNVDSCLNNSPYVEGYVFEVGNKIIGYGMIAKSFSTEFGGECVWIEDIYIEAEYRSKGIGTRFINYIRDKYKNKILRLEAEQDNKKALDTYKKNGFKKLPYMELVYVPN